MRWDAFGEQHGDLPFLKHLVRQKKKERNSKQKQLMETMRNRWRFGDASYGAIAWMMDQMMRCRLELKCLQTLTSSVSMHSARKHIELLFMNHTQCLFSTANYIGKFEEKQVRKFDFALFDECCQMQQAQPLCAFRL